MRKKLDTRFPAARIKKIMQADEDVGKIAMAVPLLVSKALELFLQDLCDRTYDITLQRGAKTMNSLHLKQCVQSFGVFDFLRHIVSKVPDIGHPDGSGEERHTRKRKSLEGEDNETDDDAKKSKEPMGIGSSTSRGRRRGRGRGRGRPPLKAEDIPPVSPTLKPSSSSTAAATASNGYGPTGAVRDFDLNENPEGSAAFQTASGGAEEGDEEEEFSRWAPPSIDLALSRRPMHDDDEDYDDDGEGGDS